MIVSQCLAARLCSDPQIRHPWGVMDAADRIGRIREPNRVMSDATSCVPSLEGDTVADNDSVDSLTRFKTALASDRSTSLTRWYDAVRSLKAALVGARIGAGEFDGMARWRDRSGQPLSIWHIVELARLPKHQRSQVLGEMEAGVWTVALLRKWGRAKARERNPGESGKYRDVEA
jgi:hypothetical protein